MATLGDVITLVENQVNNAVNVTITSAKVEPIVQTRYELLYDQFLWRQRLRDFVLTTVAQVNSEASTVVVVTQGDATVTSAGTPFAASMVGRQIQVGTDRQYYFVASFTATSSIELGTGESASATWAASSASGESFRVFQTIYTIPTDADEIISMASDIPMEEGNGGRVWLDYIDAEREHTNDRPSHWVYAGEDASGVPEVEIWPVPTVARLLRGQYSIKYASLASTATININVPLLVAAATADVIHMLSMTTGPEESQLEPMALFYERKAEEIFRKILPKELAKLSPVRRLERRSTSRRRFRGTDYEVTHHIF